MDVCVWLLLARGGLPCAACVWAGGGQPYYNIGGAFTVQLEWLLNSAGSFVDEASRC